MKIALETQRKASRTPLSWSLDRERDDPSGSLAGLVSREEASVPIPEFRDRMTAYRSLSRTPRMTAGFQVGVPTSERGCTNTNSSPVSAK